MNHQSPDDVLCPHPVACSCHRVASAVIAREAVLSCERLKGDCVRNENMGEYGLTSPLSIVWGCMLTVRRFGVVIHALGLS
jgi:hypothetical protein